MGTVKGYFLELGLIVLPALLLTSSVLAAEPPRTREVTAAVVASFPPFYQLNENGLPTGFAIETMDEIAKSSGLHINYLVFDSWAEVLDAVRSGKAQLVPNLGITEERGQNFLFTPSIITFPISIIIRSDTTDVNGLADLGGRRVGTVDKNVAVNLLKGHEDIRQTTYDNFPVALFELLAGNLDAIVYPEPVAWRFANDAALEEKIKIAGPPLKEIRRAIAIGKNEKNLHAMLAPAVDELIKSPRFREIYLSWFGAPKPLLTAEHTAWIAAVSLIVILITMFAWRYLSVVRLNETIRQSQEQLRDNQNRLEDEVKKRTAELERSEEKFRGIFDFSSTAVVTSDKDGKLIVWNNAFRQMFGYGDEELQNSSFLDLIHTDDIESSRDYLGRIFRGEIDSIRIEQRWVGKEKSIQWGEISVVPLRDSRGNITSSIGSILDITERKMAERELQERENQLREFGASASDWYWEMDEGLCFSYFSENFTNVTGVSPEYLLGKTRRESGNPGVEQEKWNQHLDDLAKHRPFRNFVHPRAKPDGTIAWLSISGKPMTEADGSFRGYHGIGLNITETKISQRQLLDLSSAIDQMSEPVVVLDNEDRFVFTNQAYQQLNNLVIDTIEYGMKFEDHIKAIAESGLWPDALGRKQEWIDERMASHRNPSGYFELKRQDGTWFLGIEKKLPSGGQVLLLTDISIIKKNQAELIQAKEEAEFANQAKTDFLSSMSHELRTPMHAILGFAQMLELNPDELLTEKQESCVSHILKGGGHLLELIDQVLELNEIEAKRLSLNFDHVSLRDIIDESLHLIRTRARDEGIEIIDQTSGEELPGLWTDSTRLTQVLLNLLSNAVKYNRKDGTVTLTCQEKPGQMIRVSVIDTGMGIPVEKQTELFKPFERLGRESGEIEGTGIGLTITRQIIELLGGQVNYESGDKGSSFWVDIPAGDKLDGSEGENRAMEKPALVPEVKAEGGMVRTILYVEDNPDNMRLMETIISRLTNTKMLTAYNIELGIDLARSYNPELILMDLDLPGMNGIEALRQLQDTVQTKNIPVVAITAAAMPKDIEEGLEAGFREYITRPIDIPNILRVIEETIDSTMSVA